jgi:periplasmic divalent cation tolerance protein
MTDKRVVLTTCGSIEEARKVAHELVERKLAACANIIPGVESIYRWKDKVETSTEYLLVIKTTASAFTSLRDLLGELHSYEIPECVEIAITDGSAPYLKWMEESVR